MSFRIQCKVKFIEINHQYKNILNCFRFCVKRRHDACTAIHNVSSYIRQCFVCQFSTSRGAVACHTKFYVIYYTSIYSVFKPLSSCYPSSWELESYLADPYIAENLMLSKSFCKKMTAYALLNPVTHFCCQDNGH